LVAGGTLPLAPSTPCGGVPPSSWATGPAVHLRPPFPAQFDLSRSADVT